jgi:hypothetical protein
MAGRPKKEEKKKLKHDIHFKVNDYEYALLKMYSECENLSVSQLIRNKAMNAVMYDAQRAVERSEVEFIAHKKP